jgi:hypothetical protein
MVKYVESVPKCLDDKCYLKLTSANIIFKDESSYGVRVDYCPECNKYLGKEKMEGDIKEAALSSYNFFYINKKELEDIKEVKIISKE